MEEENDNYLEFIDFFNFLSSKGYEIYTKEWPKDNDSDTGKVEFVSKNIKFDYDLLILYFKNRTQPVDFYITLDDENIGQLLWNSQTSLSACHVRGKYDRMHELYKSFMFFQNIEYYGSM